MTWYIIIIDSDHQRRRISSRIHSGYGKDYFQLAQGLLYKYYNISESLRHPQKQAFSSHRGRQRLYIVLSEGNLELRLLGYGLLHCAIYFEANPINKHPTKQQDQMKKQFQKLLT